MTRYVHDNKNGRAYTLIEMLVVISVLGVVATVIAAAVSSGILVWDRTQNYDKVRMDAILSMDLFERELHNAVSYYDLKYEGDSTSITFCKLLGGSGQIGDDRYGLAEVAYRYDTLSSALVRRSRKYPYTATSRPDSREMFSDVQTVRFSYSRWPEDDVTPDVVWQDRWENEEQGRPYAVRIRMRIGDEDRPVEIDRIVFMPMKTFDTETQVEQDD